MAIQTRITQRFDVLSNWIQNDIVLLQGELAVVDCGNQTRFKIGDGEKSFTQLPFIDQNQLCTNWLAANAVSQGLHAASVPYGFAAGAYLCANASFSQVLGFDAKTISSDTYSFVWNGDDTRAIEDYYTSHGKGSFSVNPLSGLSGVFIGEQNLAEVLDENSGSIITIDDRISGICKESDLSIIKLSSNDYDDLVISGAVLSDALYVIEGSYEDVRGQQIKNMAPGTNLSDAVNLEQLTEVSSRAYDTYTQTEVDQKIASAQYFKKYVVQTLPLVADADVRGIYLVPSSDPETQNTYDEYVVVGEGSSKAWEKIGAKSIDLSGYKTKQLSVDSPTASDSATAFIDTISQDENGVITATKKNIQAASTSLAGIVQLNNTLTSTATNQAATASAVKSLNDAKVETSIKVAGQTLTADVTAATISSAIGLDQYLTAVPSDYKTYAQTKQSLSSDGYATQEQLDTKSAISVDNEHADANIIHISQEEYNQLVVDDEVLSNVVYVISSDYVDAYGQQIKNVADPTDLSDAATKGYVDSNFQPAGNYLTAVPDAYKTYAATLSSLSSTYSLTSHTHSDYVPTTRKINGMQLSGDINVGTITGITMNGASKGTSGVVDLGTVLTTHQSLTGYYTKADLTGTNGVLKDYSLTSHTHGDYVLSSRTVAGQALTADVTAATISSAIGLSNYYGKTETSSAAQISAADYALSTELSAKSSISVDSDFAPMFKFEHISLEDYISKNISSIVDGDTLYVISSENMTVFDQKIVDLAPGEDPTDAPNMSQLTEVSAKAYDTYTRSEVDSKIASAQYFKKYVVQSLPSVAEADERGIYLVPGSDPETQNTYDEYVVVGEGSQKTWEKIGAKNIDLSGYKTKQDAKTSPTSSGSTTSFIDTISQDANGVITATKKSVQMASTSQAGIVQLNNTLTSTSMAQAATANAVKLTNDKFADYSLTSHTHNDYVLSSRTVAGQALSADVTAATISSAIGLSNYALDISALHKTGDETAAGKKTFSDAFTIGTRKSGSTVGTKSFTYGVNNVASGEGSFAGGQNSVASQYGAHAEGYDVSATGYMSFAVGQGTLASGYTAYAEGYSTKATGSVSHAEGAGTVAVGADSHAECNQVSATGANSHAEGYMALAAGDNSHAEGSQVSATARGSHAEGGQTKALGEASHAEGQYTLASAYCAHAEGNYTSAIQYVAHAEGQGTLASGYVSHAEGYYTSATYDAAHAEGQQTIASGNESHAEGGYTNAIGVASHSEGYGTIAQNNYEHAQGAYNVSNAGNQLSSQTIDSVGIGTYNAHKNATEVMQNGDAYFLGVGGYDGTNAVAATSKPLAAVLSAKVETSVKVAGQTLTADVTAATISSAIGLSCYLPLKGGTIANPTGYTDLWLSDGKTNGYAELGVEKGNHYIELFCTSADSYIDADNYTYRFPNKNGTLARQEDLNYALSTATGILSSGSYVYDVADRTITTIGINQSTTPVIVRLPAAGNGARDFILRIEISSASAPTFTFANTAGLDFESEDDDWAIMEPGVNLVSFTETKR